MIAHAHNMAWRYEIYVCMMGYAPFELSNDIQRYERM
jgi:hypothetical protein